MPENAIDRLNDLVDAILAGRVAQAVVDADLASLALIAIDLRDLPRPDFRAELGRRYPMDRLVLPEGLHTVTPYFVVSSGDGFIDFLKRAFGADLVHRFTRPDGSVMHAEVRIGDSMVELGQANEKWASVTMGIHLYVPDVDRVYASAIAAGATSLYPLTDQPYGDREGSVRDPFGNHWYIATHQHGDWKPEGFSNVNVYLHPRGAAKMIDFLRDVFGAAEIERTPAADGSILHATLRMGNSAVELGEAHAQWQPMAANLHFFVRDADAVYDRAIAAGATSIFPVVDQPYGERSGGVTDPFGNAWFVATPK